MTHKKSIAIAGIAATLIAFASGIAYAAYDYPSSGSVTGAKVIRVYIDRDPAALNQSDSQARLFVRFDTRVCGTPSASADNTLAGIDIRPGQLEFAEMVQSLAVAAKLSGGEVNVRTNNGNATVGCHLVRLSLD